MALSINKTIKVPKRTTKSTDLPTTEEEWVTYVNKLHDRSLADRRKHEMQWVVNLSYYLGYQNLVLMPNTGMIQFNNQDHVPLSINRLGSFIESRHSKLIRNRPVARVIPDTNELSDIRGAKSADMVLKHLHRALDMDSETDRLIMQMLICGTSFLKNLWDPLTGDFVTEKKVPTGEDEEFEIDPDTGQIAEDKIFLGEVSTKAVSAFQILVENESCPEIRDQGWVMERTHMPIIEIEKMYPHLKGKIEHESKFTSKTEFERILERLSSPVFASAGSVSDNGNDEVNNDALVKTLWVKPNHVYEKGVVCVVIGSQVGFLGIYPNDYGRNNYPYVKFTEKQSGFHFWNQATIERLIPIQKLYNKVREKKAKNIFDMANLKWLLAKGSQVSEESITDEVGEVIEYNSSVPKPEIASLSPLPNFVREFSQELITDMRDVGGQREAQATPPQNLTAGVALQVAAEQADEIITPITRRLVKGFEITAHQQLLLVSQEWSEPRKVKVLGNASDFDVQWLSGLDLKAQTDVHIEVESMFPEFRGSKQQRLFDLWDRRIIDDKKTFMQALRFGNFDVLIDEEEKLEEAVKVDIQSIKRGKQPEIHPVQNHVAYVKQLSRFIQTPEFMRMPVDRKNLAIQNLQAHLQFLVPNLPAGGEPEMQQNQASVGTPFGAAVPPGAPKSPGA